MSKNHSRVPKILLIGPHLISQGGVSGYYSVMLPLLQKSEKFEVIYQPIGLQNKGKLKSLTTLLYDLKVFYRLLKKEKPDLVFFNPAFELKNFIREGCMIYWAHSKKIKTIVFFRGWIKSFIDRYPKWKFFFNITFRKANAFIELAAYQKKQLEVWGVKKPIYLETTAFDKNLIINFSMEERIQTFKEKNAISILFLARIEKAKGVFELLEAYQAIVKEHPEVELTIAGDGNAMQEAKAYVKQHQINNVNFPGFVRGEEKARLFSTHQIYCLPSYSEGMPNSVLEAMAFGMPIVTTPVGGLRDFFEDGKMGYFAEIGSSGSLTSMIFKLIQKPELMTEMALYNHHLSIERFSSEKVSERISEIILKTLHS